jgi:archaellum component FlaC
LKKLTGNTDIEDSLARLDKLTQEEARMASAELLKMTHVVDGKVMGVDDRVKSVQGKIQDVRSDVHDVGNQVQSVEGKVEDVRSDVHDVGNQVQGIEREVQDVRGDVRDVGNKVQDVDHRVQGVDDKLEQANRSLSLLPLLIVPRTHSSWQETTSKIVFYSGFRPQIHPLIITLHAKPITTVLLNGFFKEVYSINGNPLVPSCGYTENVR